ncbi:2'-5' RNA ligase family protein [Candidatus Chrysopegis kryptomonas]|jgi:2'-5' RNA ligase|uniref:2'-5' RNA ligase n=1 Tax=Candidatus Chryseopegocella kryptomonas TaxID=1633643 RepID=A0A0P1N0N5_9BACT|nr:2'-5' RNA ligase family protein [Candidatus Chrysopegis kryptomonas]CUT01788.1 2'-5' RNA ligase [Candidatus Chrysopegis kryptomonas]
MGKKTHKTAVVIIPPKEIWSPIQKIREKYDRQFRRWMPHITLLYPFRPFEEFESVYPDFERVCKEVESFEIELSEFRFFKHYGESYTIWLNPEPAEGVKILQEKLQSIVPDCDDVRKFENGFTPHLSVGQVKGRENLEKLLKELQSSWVSLKFVVDSVFFIWRNDPPDDIFRIWKEVKFSV